MFGKDVDKLTKNVEKCWKIIKIQIEIVEMLKKAFELSKSVIRN